MTTPRKTVQAIKISASWTPNPETAAAMAAAAFPGQPLRIEGGRTLVRHAIATDMTDPEHVVRVAQRIKRINDELRSTGTIHTLTTSAGSVPAEVAEHLPNPEPERHPETDKEAA